VCKMIILNRYKVVDMNKFKRFIFISVLLISIVLFTLLFTIKVYSKDIPQYNYITVEEGDTIWSIASNYLDKSNIEIRKLVYVISNENNIYNASIYPGDVIKIPMNLE
jgi:cell division protein YceG involved in septum cleavage